VHSFGDSITVGAGADHFCNGYQALFTTTIGANGDDEGISGSMFVTSTYNIMSWFVQVPESQVVATNNYKTHDYDINTVLPAYNDVTNFGADPTHLAQFQADLLAALSYTGTLGKMTLVGTTLYASDVMQPGIPLHTNANVDQYVAVIKSVVAQVAATGLPVYLVDTNAIYDPNTMSSNNIHPDNYGHAVIAQAFIEAYEAHK
jgi:lysophospholipase L1-like esterase